MKKIATVILFTTIAACRQQENKYDASGTFEAVETIVSSEATGTIKELNIEEGQTLTAGQSVGYIDSVQLYLKKKQLQAQIRSVLSKKPDISLQTAALQEQLRQAQREQQRTSNLLTAGAATQKQLDDANTQIEVIKKQIAAQQSSLGITSKSINQETSPVAVEIQQLNDQLQKCRIVNPVNGTVLTKYAEVNEITAVGKPVYKIAALSSIILRAYFTGDQLARIKAGQQVNVFADASNNTYKTYQGTIEWISSSAEFTPKTIQTKNERANLVYAVKIRVKNDGFLKIGMYGEIKF
ncbi:MAG: HlyD family efflux transporter periplasmic adaptor subunit [Chitinophagaceae bacterium]|nr:HlyD family efflux transporter periplasmic adaptor subunit [Chitinophagaceae bacterium]